MGIDFSVYSPFSKIPRIFDLSALLVSFDVICSKALRNIRQLFIHLSWPRVGGLVLVESWPGVPGTITLIKLKLITIIPCYLPIWPQRPDDFSPDLPK